MRNARNRFQKFASGDESLDDITRSRRPLSLDDDDLRTTIEMDSKLTCKGLEVKFHVGEETIKSYLHSLGKCWKISKLVSHSWTSDNKFQRITIYSSRLSRLKNESLFDRILTRYEKRVAYSDNKMSHHWLSQRDLLRQTTKETEKVCCAWWTSTGIIHNEYLYVWANYHCW